MSPCSHLLACWLQSLDPGHRVSFIHMDPLSHCGHVAHFFIVILHSGTGWDLELLGNTSCCLLVMQETEHSCIPPKEIGVSLSNLPHQSSVLSECLQKLPSVIKSVAASSNSLYFASHLSFSHLELWTKVPHCCIVFPKLAFSLQNRTLKMNPMWTSTPVFLLFSL